MKVVEKFISINGEGVRAGELAVFVRFRGCNLRCSYCDTMWANEKDCPYAEESPEEIRDYILSTGIKNVTLTGGEPLLQQEMPELLSLLAEHEEIRVEIETNGAVDLSRFLVRDMAEDSSRLDDKNMAENCLGMKTIRPVFTMDYKLPSSGWEHAMICDNFYMLQAEDTVKFVCGSEEDLQRAAQVIRQYDLIGRCHVYFSPVFGSIEPERIVDFMIEEKLNDVRLQIQIHKVIWDPERRGV